jgi:drug/metabolite transporter (DMT)-like permease
MLFPLVASLSKAFGVMVDKVLLSRKNLSVSRFIVWLFLFLAIFTFPILFFDNWISVEILTPRIIFLFIAMIALALSWNILYYLGIKNESVQEFQPILMLSPLAVIILTHLFFPQESSQRIFFISLIAATVLIFSHLEKGHLVFKRESLGLLICVVLMSLEVLIIKELLFFFAPASLYFFRCFFLFCIFLLLYRRQISSSNNILPNLTGFFLTTILGVAQMVTSFYGYQQIGVIFTTLVMILSPVLVYLFAFLFLKEKTDTKKIVGGVIILGCVIFAYLVK